MRGVGCVREKKGKWMGFWVMYGKQRYTKYIVILLNDKYVN
nr:MAG TPA: hypothetical protein [Caudoviricetes sp.]